MKIKKKYSFKDGHQIWRLLVTDSEKLLIESRNTDQKEAFFTCLDLFSGESKFTDHQFSEKYWLGIETIYKDKIFIHTFAKPDMPGHRGLTVFDLNSQIVVWENKEYAFLFIYEDKVYTYQERFEGRRFFTLDFNTGEFIEDIGENSDEINLLREKVESEKDYSNYLFPEPFLNVNIDSNVSEIIKNTTGKLELVGYVEYTIFDKLLLLSYHTRSSDKNISNTFVAFNIDKKKKIFSKVLNKKVNAFAPDSFFVYRDLLLIVKEKTEVEVYKLIIDK
ncbi:MAG: DUF4905 domain-containing protein [Melioribacteraceae bacterium]|nr:DUF4905 domain-containing protein [Melioribacteraceae bacterium]